MNDMNITGGTQRQGEVILQVRDLVVAYGKAEVVHGVSFNVRGGEFVVILGRNGAGKSSTMQAMSGLIPKRGGSVRFRGEDLTQASAQAIVQAGLVHVLEGHRVFHALTVEENLMIGTWAGPKRGDRRLLERIYALFPELAERRNQPASRLSGGQQQILAVGAGVIAEPRLLVLDEPSAGLAPMVIERILSAVADLCRDGMAILLVEQMVETALRFADYGYLIETGRIAASGQAAEIRASEALRHVYLGRQDAPAEHA
ncbi:ABC transporter ATP-binding protein [Paucibacter sp. R3-3]|uniref:ABC transporter ATP-binding protein n=1 Tax=Roseateles agri TaxID=3098619 RepID=A0ABU5DP23_9BURK|nr:ABC transporter ATP-binding protein [Paucibacter sp. R3-3]MDY0748056.1 ABC transporter ATP-binding protein [Paucibacter sp. R3-3]